MACALRGLLVALSLLAREALAQDARTMAIQGALGSSSLGAGGFLNVDITISGSINQDTKLYVYSTDKSVWTLTGCEETTEVTGLPECVVDYIVPAGATGALLTHTITLSGVAFGNAFLMFYSDDYARIIPREDQGADLNFVVLPPKALSTTSPNDPLNTLGVGGTMVITVDVTGNPGGLVLIRPESSDETVFTTSPATVTLSTEIRTTTVTLHGQSVGTAQLTMVSLDQSRISDSASVSFTTFNARTVTVTSESYDDTVGESGQLNAIMSIEDVPGMPVIINLESSQPSLWTVSPSTVTYQGTGDLSKSIVLSGHVPGDAQLVITSGEPPRIASPQPKPFSTIATRQITVTPATTANTLGTTGTLAVDVTLNADPGHSVVVDVTNEGAVSWTLSADSLTFDSDNLHHTITLTGATAGMGSLVFTSNDLPRVATTTPFAIEAIESRTLQALYSTTTPMVGIAEDNTGQVIVSIQASADPGNPVLVDVSSSDPNVWSVEPAQVLISDGSLTQQVVITAVGAGSSILNLVSMDTPRIATPTAGQLQAFETFDAREISITYGSTSPLVGFLGTLEVTLAISGPPGDPVNIQVQSSNQNTWSVSDSVVTFTDSVLQRVVTITSLKVGLSSLILASFQPSRIVSPEPVDFESIDPRQLTVTSPSALSTVGVGGDMDVTITAEANPGNPIDVDITSSDESVWTVSHSTVQFADGQLVRTITLHAVAAGSAFLNMVPMDTHRIGTPAQTLFQTFDARELSISFASDLPMVGVGGSVEVSIALTDDPGLAVSVTVSSSDPTKWSVSPSQVSFDNGVLSHQVTVTGIAAGFASLVLVSQDTPRIATPSSSQQFETITPRTVSVIGEFEATSMSIYGTLVMTLTASAIPGHPVTLTISSSDTSKWTVDKSTIVFSNTFTSDTVTVSGRGLADSIGDANLIIQPDDITRIAQPANTVLTAFTPHALSLSSASTSAPPTVGVTAQLAVSVTCAGKPGSVVQTTVSSSDPSVFTVSPSTVTFSDNNLVNQLTITGISSGLAEVQLRGPVGGERIKDTNEDFSVIAPRTLSLSGYFFANVDVTSVGVGGTLEVLVSCSSFPGISTTVTVSSSDSGVWLLDSAATITFSDDHLVETVVIKGVATGSANLVLVSSDETRILSKSDVAFETILPRTLAITNNDNIVLAGIGDVLPFTVTCSSNPGGEVPVDIILTTATTDGSRRRLLTSSGTDAVRLADGADSNTGRLEVNVNGAWGTVCDDDFTDIDAKVVCRELGYDVSDASTYSHTQSFGGGSGSILMDDVGCSGTENTLASCSHTSAHNCGHSEDVGVTCTGASAGSLSPFSVTPATLIFSSTVTTLSFYLQADQIGDVQLSLQSRESFRISNPPELALSVISPRDVSVAIGTAVNVPSTTSIPAVISINDLPGKTVVVTLSSSDTSVWTVSPPSITFDDNTLEQTVSLVGNSAGTAHLVLNSEEDNRVHDSSTSFDCQEPLPLSITYPSVRPLIGVKGGTLRLSLKVGFGDQGSAPGSPVTVYVTSSNLTQFRVTSAPSFSFGPDTANYVNDILLTGAELTGTSKLILLSSSEHRIQSYDPTVVEVFAPRALLISTDSVINGNTQTVPVGGSTEVQVSAADLPGDIITVHVSTSDPSKWTVSPSTIVFYHDSPGQMSHTLILQGQDRGNAQLIFDSMDTSRIASQSFDFLSMDVTRPTVVSVDPPEDSTTVGINHASILIDFDENINSANGTIRVHGGNQPDTVLDPEHAYCSLSTVSPSTRVLCDVLPHTFGEELTEYTISVREGDFVDTAIMKNEHRGKAWTVSTVADTTAPVLLSSYPSHGQVNVTIAVDTITLHFNEPVVRGGGDVVLSELQSGVEKLRIPFDSQRITIENSFTIWPKGSNVTISLSNGCVYDADCILNKELTEYELHIPSGLFTDMAITPNSLVEENIRFTTGNDVTAPVIASSEPNNGGKFVDLALSQLTLLFSEEVQAVQGGSIVLRKVGHSESIVNSWSAPVSPLNEPVFQVASLSGSVQVSGREITIPLPVDVVDEETVQYQIEITPGAFVDKAQLENGHAGLSSDSAQAIGFKSTFRTQVNIGAGWKVNLGLSELKLNREL